jgi:hypothetical protein
MPEQFLHRADIMPAFETMAGRRGEQHRPTVVTDAG